MKAHHLPLPASVAVIGGGLTGLTAAIRLAGHGIQVELFEAAPALGGRTRSFFEPTMQQQCDNGPHLLIGAYDATQALLREVGADKHVHWQSSLSLPLWDAKRGHFRFQPSEKLPFAPAMLLAAAAIPGHDISSAIAMLRLAVALQRNKPPQAEHVAGWLKELRIPGQLVTDMLEPLCLGAMNEGIDTACPISFKRVLKESFAGRKQARLGWFTAPLQTALIEPLARHAEKLGVQIHTGDRVRRLEEAAGQVMVDDRPFDKAVVALPPLAADRLHNRRITHETRAITNIHLWLHQAVAMPAPLVGCINGTGQWFFDVSQQWGSSTPGKHICAVISADAGHRRAEALIELCLHELALLCGSRPQLMHSRIISERRATTLVRPDHAIRADLTKNIIDACERPAPGQLPATIESAVRRGEIAANRCLATPHYQRYPL